MHLKALCSVHALPFRKPELLTKTMKLIAIFLLAACLQVSAKSYSQRVTISGKNMPLQQVFKEITKQTGYYFIYKEKWTSEFKNVDVQVKNAPLVQALDICFNNQPYTYAIIENTVVVKPKTFIVEEEKAAPAPMTEIKGFVTSENGAVSGVTVILKRTGKGTTTNGKGEFRLPEINEDDILVISSIGYETQEVPLKDKKGFVYVQLKIAVDRLDEIVIRPYGQSTSRRLNTGSVTKITAEEIQKQPVNNILQALVGRTTGMSISQSSGLPGSDISFQIRGQNSLNLTNGFVSMPLVVIDGVPYPSLPITNSSQYASSGYNPVSSPIGYGSTLYNINANDIESVEILKDADATAIYGSRAANGVMLITTKKGKQGRTKIDVNVNTGVSMNLRQVDLLNAQEYLAMRREAFKNSGATPTIANAPDLLVWDSTRNNNWQKELLGHTAHITDASISMSGGAGGTSFLISGNYHKENTVYPDRRGSESGSAHYSIGHTSSNGKFSATLSGMVSINKIDLPGGSYGQYAYQMPPNFQAFDSAGNLKWDWIADNASTNSKAAINPYSDIRTSFHNKTFSLISNLQLRYNILPGLDLKTSFGLTKLETDQQLIRPKSSSNPFNTFFQSSNVQSINRNQTLNFEPQLNYVGNIADGKLDAMVGGTVMKTINEMPSAISAYNFTSDAYINDITLAGTLNASQGYSAYQYASIFARANYNWENKYILNGSFRRDGSSRFGPNNRYGNFGAIGAAWLFNKEKFAQNLGFLSYGKLRGSLGWVGSDNVGDYSFLSTYSPISFYTYAGNPGLIPSRLYNLDYSWESTRKLEAALELGFLKDRILVSAAWFQSRTGNQLVNYPVSTQAGFGGYSANLNAAVVENKGWEIELNTTNVTNKNFRWTTSFNITIPQNRLLKFDGIEKTSYTSSLLVGKPVSAIYRVHFTGLDSAGKPQYEDVNKNGNIEWFGGLAAYGKGDKQYVGKTYADYYGGLTNSFSYKGFQFDFTFQFTGGLTKANYLSAIGQPGAPINLPRKALQDLRAKGLDKYFLKSTYVPDYIYYTSSVYSDASYMNVNFIRLTNAAISYNLPEKMLKPLKLGSLRAYVQAQNLFVISNYDGFDPESGATAMPPLFRLVGGIQCSF
jgi:TonB-dependent starch-binding outer membrane protein SusC